MSEGPECKMKKVKKDASQTMLKYKDKIKFFTEDGDEVGTLDLNGPGLSFEGIADESAIIFIDWLSKVFAERMQEEYDRGLKDGKAKS